VVRRKVQDAQKACPICGREMEHENSCTHCGYCGSIEIPWYVYPPGE